MRDVSSKYHSLRRATASASLKVSPATVQAIRTGQVPKAHPIESAKIAAMQAAKNTSMLIPDCHPVPLDYVGVEIELGESTISISTEVKAIWKTGVEMEALTAASVAALTLYDMLKPIDDKMEIVSVKLTGKEGGKSNLHYRGKGLKAAVIVISDSTSQGKRTDTSGKLAVEKLRALGFDAPLYKVLPDEEPSIVNELKELADHSHIDLILTTGGTGLGPRDVTAEATAKVVQRRLEGAEEALRSFGQNRLPTAMLTRGIVGVRGNTLIINLPGSTGGVEDGFNALFPAILHTFAMIRGGGHEEKE